VLLHSQIQAVARPPAALNGRKGVTAAFSTIGIIYPLVAIAGFYVRACRVAMLLLFADMRLQMTTSGCLTRDGAEFALHMTRGVLCPRDAASHTRAHIHDLGYQRGDGLQAFGNNVSSLVVLSLPPQHQWAAITAKLLLIIHASFNYQVCTQT
jgi:hypothetical protein